MTAASLIQQGKTALQNKNGSAALSAFQQAVENGGGVTALLGMADAQQLLGDSEA